MSPCGVRIGASAGGRIREQLRGSFVPWAGFLSVEFTHEADGTACGSTEVDRKACPTSAPGAGGGAGITVRLAMPLTGTGTAAGRPSGRGDTPVRE
ncbi:hypothetical protein B1H18_13370 [Streptomyces tsukubensis]|uniref:Uncharacterized protein n=1 Tax=Streptomyces tsukubensis TaxID=83656 RepID=A0A1V4AB28_9ACTN|nr:hypothetical protein B1H18_13370 [Streptomyces tsukubensis]